MTISAILRCDGCGQIASPEHIARRLRRLEWVTRYRPVHIQTLLLGGVAPHEDAEFLYAPGGEFRGEAEALLRAVGIEIGRPPFETQGKQKAVPTSPAGKTVESIHAEFQAAGLFLTYILECPLEPDLNAAVDPNPEADVRTLVRKHLSAVASRIRRSLKPRRVMLVTEMPQELVQDIVSLDLGCPVMLDDRKPFRFSSSNEETSFSRFREIARFGERELNERAGPADCPNPVPDAKQRK